MNTIFVFLAVLAAFVVLILCIAPLRRRCVTVFVFRFFKKVMPPISETEKEALLAGKVGEEKTLLYKPNWRGIFSPALWGEITEEEEAYLNGPVEKLCAIIDDYKISKTREISDEVWDCIREIRIFAMDISKTAQAKVFVKIASRSFSVAVICMVPNSLGPRELLHRYGTKWQKAFFLPGLDSGEETPAFGLTSPSAGSDAGGSMKCSGEVYLGEDGRPWMRLNWEKRYITLGSIATLLGLGFKLYDPRHVLGGKENLGITVALIPINDEMKSRGVSIGRFHDPLGATFYNGPNWGTDVCLPIEEYVIGGVDGIGNGWTMLMECLSTGRFVSLPSVSVGGAKLACFAVGAYAGIRDQFKMLIGEFGGIQEPLAKMVGLTYLMDATLLAGTGIVDNGGTSPVLSAIAKCHCTENLKKVINLAMPVLGGKGIMRGPKNFLERVYSAVEIAVTVEGANILTRCMMIFGQGVIRCHPWLLSEMLALEIADKKEALREFDRAFMGHIKYFTSVLLRGIFYSLGGSRFSSAPGNEYTNRYYREMNRMSSALALTTECTLLCLGGRLKKEERISARLGDVLSYLYQGGAALRRYTDTGSTGERSLPVDWSLQYCLHEMQEALIETCRNFPSRFLGWMLLRIIFPFGRPYEKPSDALEQKLARMITSPTEMRDVLTEGIYVPPLDDLDENLALLEVTLWQVALVAPILERLNQARKKKLLKDPKNFEDALEKGIITSEEKADLEKVEVLRAKVIAVDDFETLG